MPRYPAGEPWRGGRVVFPHTTPDGHLVNLYGRAVGTAEQVPKAKRHDHLPGEKGYFNATALQAGDGGLWVCEGAFDALALLPLASRAWSRSLACRAGAGTGCARSASWSSPWTPMPPGSSSGASSLDRPRCGGSGWRGSQRQRMGGARTSATPGRRGCWRWARGLQQRREERSALCRSTSESPGRNASPSWSSTAASRTRTPSAWRGRGSRTHAPRRDGRAAVMGHTLRVQTTGQRGRRSARVAARACPARGHGAAGRIPARPVADGDHLRHTWGGDL